MFADTMILPKQLLEAQKAKEAAKKKGARASKGGAKRPQKRTRARSK